MKNKVFIFIIGLLAGLTLGVLFSVAIKELLVQFKELHISLNRINLRQSQLSQRLDSIQGQLLPDARKTVTASTPVKTHAKPMPAAEIKNMPPQQNANNLTPTKPAISADEEDDSNVVVMTNQLVSALSVHLHNNDSALVSKKTEDTDSTLASMSNVDYPNITENYRIEFWKSPLNYKGYKMSDGKIVLYGITPDTPVNVTLTNNTYYLQVGQTVYLINFTDDYKPFEKVLDKSVLKEVSI